MPWQRDLKKRFKHFSEKQGGHFAAQPLPEKAHCALCGVASALTEILKENIWAAVKESNSSKYVNNDRLEVFLKNRP